MAYFSRETSVLLTIFALTFFSGFLLANAVLLSASFIPLFIYIMSVLIAPPKVEIEKKGLPSSAGLGDIIDIKVAVKATGGPGTVVVWDEVPAPFQLVEGNNYQIISKDFGEKEFSFAYKMRCTKCGYYWLGGGRETKHIFGLVQGHLTNEEVRPLKVLPTLPKIRKMRLPLPTAPKVHPSGSLAKIGPLSTDFKEIRNYFYGDSFKIINWKASARAAGYGKLEPLVNEYEREGKLSIWMFLDANPDLRIGTPVENGLEYSIQATYIVANYFLSKGYNLGMYIYNRRGDTFNFDTGRRHFVRIADRLLSLTPINPNALEVYWDEGFSMAVEKNRKYLVSRSPGIVVITHLTSSSLSHLLSGFRKILAYRVKRRQANVLVINVLPYGIFAKANDWEISAAQMLDVASRSTSKRLRNFGVHVLDWDPKKESVETMLLGTLKLR